MMAVGPVFRSSAVAGIGELLCREELCRHTAADEQKKLREGLVSAAKAAEAGLNTQMTVNCVWDMMNPLEADHSPQDL